MKKIILVSFALLACVCTTTKAQEKSFYGIGNRVGVGLGVSTNGIGVDASVCFTKYLAARVGVNFMPDFKINTDVDVEGLDANINVYGQQTTVSNLYRQEFGKTMSSTIDTDISLKRTTIDVNLDVYPFGGSFFITGGLSFGGEQVVKATGHSEAMADFATLKSSKPEVWNAVQNAVGIDVDESLVGFNEKGDVTATAKVKKVRPYIGLGWGRLIPKNRVGFRFELGAQFQGRPTIYDGDGRDILNDDSYKLDSDEKNDITKVLDYMKVYPVLKLSIRGRIL